MTWKKLPPLAADEIHRGCANCSTAARLAPLDMYVGVGFGAAFITRDDDTVWDEQAQRQDDPDMTVAVAEKMAAADPDHDWRIHRHGPMHGEIFQRQGPNEWVCVESDQGFA